MATNRVVLQLNQQQTELLDKTVARGEATDRLALIRRALKEYAERHGGAGKGGPRS